MKIYSAIHMQGGAVVRGFGDDPGETAVRSQQTPQQQAAWCKEQGARRVHVVDLDAARGGPDQWPHLSHIVRQGMTVQFGGGIRSMVQVQKLLDLGVGRVVVGTQAVHNPAWVQELATLFPGRIVLAVDSHGRDVVVEGWTERTGKDVVEVAMSMQDIGLAGFLYTDVAADGHMNSFDADTVKALREAVDGAELVAAGAIRGLDDLDVLNGLGVDGVVLGGSIHQGDGLLKQAVQRFERPEPED